MWIEDPAVQRHGLKLAGVLWSIALVLWLGRAAVSGDWELGKLVLAIAAGVMGAFALLAAGAWVIAKILTCIFGNDINSKEQHDV
jgi:hypothetical protein